MLILSDCSRSVCICSNSFYRLWYSNSRIFCFGCRYADVAAFVMSDWSSLASNRCLVSVNRAIFQRSSAQNSSISHITHRKLLFSSSINSAILQTLLGTDSSVCLTSIMLFMDTNDTVHTMLGTNLALKM